MFRTQTPWNRKARQASRLSGLCVLAALLSGFAYGLTVSEPAPGITAQEGFPQNRITGQAPNLPFLGLGLQRIEAIAATVGRANETCARIQELTAYPSSPGDTPERAELRRLFKLLSHSPLAGTLVAQARNRNTLVCIDANTELLAYYRAGIRLIGLRANLTESQKLAYLAHELAHVPQHHRYSDNRYFPTADLILLRRAREAAAEALATWVTWELKEAGIPAPWQAKRNDHFFGDIAEAFENAWLDMTGPGQNHPDRDICAARVAFDQWFASPARLNLYDGMTVAHLQRISSDAMGLVRPNLILTHRFLSGIGQLGGRNFITEVPGRWLTHAHYTDGLSSENTRRLDDLFAAAAVNRKEPAGPWALSALPKVGSSAEARRKGTEARNRQGTDIR